MRINNKGQTQLLMIVLVGGLLFGAFGGLKLGKLNPFKSSKATVTLKDEGNKEEYFKDKIKGIEYKSKETYKTQNKQASGATASTIGSRIGNLIDSSIQLIMFVLIGGVVLFVFTGINIFKYIKRAGSLAKDAALEANRYRKALKQTVKAIDKASPKMNGEDKVLKELLDRKQDEDTKTIINEMKNE